MLSWQRMVILVYLGRFLALGGEESARLDRHAKFVLSWCGSQTVGGFPDKNSPTTPERSRCV